MNGYKSYTIKIYADAHDDVIVKSLVNKKPPIIDYEVSQCLKYNELNDEYINFTKTSDSLSSFENLLKIQDHLKKVSYFEDLNKYLYLYETALLAMGIDEDHLDDFLFDVRFILT